MPQKYGFEAGIFLDYLTSRDKVIHMALTMGQRYSRSFQWEGECGAKRRSLAMEPLIPGSHANKQCETKVQKNTKNAQAAQCCIEFGTSVDLLEATRGVKRNEPLLKMMNSETVEVWLDCHPEFVSDYFNRRATKSMVDDWLLAHAQNKSSPESARSDVSSSGSGANTPVRKISAQEFERDGQILKPMVSTVDGQVTFLGSPQTHEHQKRYRRKRGDMKSHDERELLYELVMDICNDLDVTSLCHKILQNVSILLNADRCSLFLVQGEGADRVLVSKLFDVNSNSTIEECTGLCEEIRVPWGRGIAGTVAQTGRSLNIPEAYQDTRFNREVDVKTGYKTRSILCMPIHDASGDVIGVAEAINKLSIQEEPFNDKDEKVFSSYLAFCGIGLKNAQLYERSLLENKRNQLMLDLAKVIFEEQKDVASLIHKIMMHTQSLLRCARCQVLLVDEIHKGKNKRTIETRKPIMGIFSQVFDLQASDFDNDDSYHREG